jgi:DNA polymerase zeta
MPLLADTIVECGRRTLTNAVNLANDWGSHAENKWAGCEVIYGDTDSLFVRLPGRTVQEAFEFGDEFCEAVTSNNPPPVQLKLEKVYLGSIMQTVSAFIKHSPSPLTFYLMYSRSAIYSNTQKKKYGGMKYESKDQKKPEFEAKGLETVRRDQCELTQKVLRNTLVTLFRHGTEEVKKYLFRQWTLILSGGLPVSDFVLTGRVRSRYRGGRIGPVQAVLAQRLAEADPGRVVRHNERLAYVIVATPGTTFKLRDSVLTPMELLEQWDAYAVHSTYYITRHVNAALQRCLGLAPYFINIAEWYESCPKPRKRVHFWPVTRCGSSVMISSYFGSDTCAFCNKKCCASGQFRIAVCASCRKNDETSVSIAMRMLNCVDKEAQTLALKCGRCNKCYEDSSTFGATMNVKIGKLDAMEENLITPISNCSCIDCPTTYDRHRIREAQLEAKALLKSLLNKTVVQSHDDVESLS